LERGGLGAGYATREPSEIDGLRHHLDLASEFRLKPVEVTPQDDQGPIGDRHKAVKFGFDGRVRVIPPHVDHKVAALHLHTKRKHSALKPSVEKKWVLEPNLLRGPVDLPSQSCGLPIAQHRDLVHPTPERHRLECMDSLLHFPYGSGAATHDGLGPLAIEDLAAQLSQRETNAFDPVVCVPKPSGKKDCVAHIDQREPGRD
jgi:hypothetical protein